MIRSPKKKEAVPEQPDETPAAPAAPRSGPAPASGDFSALMKKLKMADRQDAAPTEVPAPEISPVQSSVFPGEQISSLDDLLEDAETPVEEAAAEVKPDPGRTGSGAGTLTETPREPEIEEVIEIIDEDPKAVMRKPKAVKSVEAAAEGGTCPERDRDR